MAKYRNDNFKLVTAMTKALADETRLRAILALSEGPLCLCQITALFGLAASTMSKHLSILQQAGLVVGRKKGRWMHFELPKNATSKEIKKALNWVVRSLEHDEQIQKDRKQLKKILTLDAETLCRKRKN